MAIAFFDFDGTLLRDDSGRICAVPSIRAELVPPRKAAELVGQYALHKLGLRSRRDVDALEAFVRGMGAEIVDPAAEYYEDYYAVFFLDPDGLKLEGMKYGEAKAARARARKRRTSSRTPSRQA